MTERMIQAGTSRSTRMMQKRTHESAVAEMMGSLVLIALFAAAVAIIAVVLFSQPPPEKIPAVSMEITNASKHIVISHDSGDAVNLSEMEVRVDDVPITSGTFTGTWSCPGCGTDFSVGDRILIDYYNPAQPAQYPNKIDVIYKVSGNQQQLLTTRYFGTMTPTPTPGTSPTTATPVPTGT